MLPIVALVVFAVWTTISVFVLALCVAAGRADRALETFMGRERVPAPAPDFVLAFAEPQAEIAPARPAAVPRTRV